MAHKTVERTPWQQKQSENEHHLHELRLTAIRNGRSTSQLSAQTNATTKTSGSKTSRAITLHNNTTNPSIRRTELRLLWEADMDRHHRALKEIAVRRNDELDQTAPSKPYNPHALRRFKTGAIVESENDRHGSHIERVQATVLSARHCAEEEKRRLQYLSQIRRTREAPPRRLKKIAHLQPAEEGDQVSEASNANHKHIASGDIDGSGDIRDESDAVMHILERHWNATTHIEPRAVATPLDSAERHALMRPAPPPAKKHTMSDEARRVLKLQQADRDKRLGTKDRSGYGETKQVHPDGVVAAVEQEEEEANGMSDDERVRKKLNPRYSTKTKKSQQGTANGESPALKEKPPVPKPPVAVIFSSHHKQRPGAAHRKKVPLAQALLRNPKLHHDTMYENVAAPNQEPESGEKSQEKEQPPTEDQDLDKSAGESPSESLAQPKDRDSENSVDQQEGAKEEDEGVPQRDERAASEEYEAAGDQKKPEDDFSAGDVEEKEPGDATGDDDPPTNVDAPAVDDVPNMDDEEHDVEQSLDDGGIVDGSGSQGDENKEEEGAAHDEANDQNEEEPEEQDAQQ